MIRTRKLVRAAAKQTKVILIQFRPLIRLPLTHTVTLICKQTRTTIITINDEIRTKLPAILIDIPANPHQDTIGAPMTKLWESPIGWTFHQKPLSSWRESKAPDPYICATNSTKSWTEKSYFPDDRATQIGKKIKESTCNWEEKRNAATHTLAADISKISETNYRHRPPLLPKQTRYHSKNTCRRHRNDGRIITQRIGHHTRNRGLPSYSRAGLPWRANQRNCRSLCSDKQHHREKSSSQPTTRRKRTVSIIGFHARPRDSDKRTMLPGSQ